LRKAYSQDSSGYKCWASSMASCSIRPTTTTPFSSRYIKKCLDCTSGGAWTLPAEAQVPGANAFSEFGAFHAAGPSGFTGYIAQRRYDEGFIANPGHFTEMVVCPGQDIDEVGLRGRG